MVYVPDRKQRAGTAWFLTLDTFFKLQECRGTSYINGRLFVPVLELISWHWCSVAVQTWPEPDNSPGVGTVGV